MRASDFIAEAKVKLKGFKGMDPKERAQRWIDRVYAQFPHEFDGNRVMVFGDGEDQQIAMFQLVPNNLKPGAVEIKWISTFPQKSGVGRRAMSILQDLASEDNITLTLYPWSKGKVSQSTLQKIYKKMGFKQDKSSQNMTWEPSINEAFSVDVLKKGSGYTAYDIRDTSGDSIGRAVKQGSEIRFRLLGHPLVTTRGNSVVDAVTDWAKMNNINPDHKTITAKRKQSKPEQPKEQPIDYDTIKEWDSQVIPSIVRRFDPDTQGEALSALLSMTTAARNRKADDFLKHANTLIGFFNSNPANFDDMATPFRYYASNKLRAMQRQH